MQREREREREMSAMLLSWQHCASPFLQLRVEATGQAESKRCVNRALIKLVQLKGICVNALLTLTLTALIYIYIYINILTT